MTSVLGAQTVRAADLESRLGEVFHSDWLVMDQSMVTTFADLTRDQEWIHVDVPRARADRGGTIVHGFLTLSMLSFLARSVLTVTDYAAALAYGLDRVRYVTPLPTGSRIRLRMEIAAVEPRGDAKLLRRRCEIEADGSERPVLVADWLTLITPA